MTNRPNLSEEEKEHYNKVAMDMIHNKTPRTDKAEQLLAAVIQIAEDLIEACGTIEPYKFAQKKKSQLDQIKATLKNVE